MVDDFYEFYKSLPVGFVLYASPYKSDDDLKYARGFCDENGLTRDDVAIRIIYSDADKTKKESVIVVKK